jgi:hypothetical protein
VPKQAQVVLLVTRQRDIRFKARFAFKGLQLGMNYIRAGLLIHLAILHSWICMQTDKMAAPLLKLPYQSDQQLGMC